MCSVCDKLTIRGDTLLIEPEYMQQDAWDLAQTARKTLLDVDFDTMVGVGLSGALILPDLSLAMGKNFFIVRKPETSLIYHDIMREPRYGVGRIGRKWLFVDDFSSTGQTHNYAIKRICELCSEHSFDSVFVGSYYYRGDEYTEF